MKAPVRAVLVLAAAALAGLGVHHYTRSADVAGWQGWVEGKFLFVGPDEPGRLVSLAAKEGEFVAEGFSLFAVESDLQLVEAERAQAALSEAEARLGRAEAAQQRPEEISVLEAQRTRAEAALTQSKPELERAKDLVSRGISPQARLDAAKAAFARDEATLTEVNRQIAVARLKSRSEDIEAAKAVVEQARSRLSAAKVSVGRRTVKTPASALVQEVFFRVGEVVPAGKPVVSLLPPGNVRLLFFVPETELARLAPGARVRAICDGCAKDIQATIMFVSAQAEFTPPVIFSRDERKKLVFRAEAQPDNPMDLRIGLPVWVSPAVKE